MTAAGLIFMISYWSLLVGLVIFCFSNILRKSHKSRRC